MGWGNETHAESVYVVRSVAAELYLQMTWLPRLLELAKKATKGKWEVEDGGVVSPFPPPTRGMMIIPVTEHDVAYIASAYPQRIIALVEVAEAAEWVQNAVIHCIGKSGGAADEGEVHSAITALGNALTRLEELEDA